MATERDPPRLHALMISLPAPGHLHPLLELASHLVASYDFDITLVQCEGLLPVVHQRFHPYPPNIRVISIPGVRPSKDFDKSQLAHGLERLILQMGTDLNRIVEDLSEQNRIPTCIIADTYVRVAQDVANRFNIAKVDFCTTSASYFSLNMHIPVLVSEGYIPLKGNDAHAPTALTASVPGLPPLPFRHIPRQFLVHDLSDVHFQTLVKPFTRIREASHVLVNSFYELESNVIDTLNGPETGLTMLPIGPLLPPVGLNDDSVTADKCSQWLDTRAKDSVLYVAFGSLFPLPATQIEELAFGLEASQQEFLWALSPFEMQALPEDFVRRTENRGIVVSWANQLAVLNHVAVGGFLTHCGWNSTLEGIYFGVPMLGWPLESDQILNFKFISEEWELGMGFEKEEDGFVGRRAIEKVVRALMQEGEVRERLRERAGQLRDAARKATLAAGGTSRKYLDRFVEDMRSCASTWQNEKL